MTTSPANPTTGVWLWEKTWSQIAEYLAERHTVLLPVGSTEQHGRHLPLGVDALVAIQLAQDVAARTGILAAPPVWYGYAPHHMAKPGTVTLRASTLIDLVEDTLSSLVYHGFTKIVIINGHRITNLPPLQIAAANVRNRTKALITIADPVYAGISLIRDLVPDGDADGQGHADGFETAQMLHLYPDLVDREALRTATDASEGDSQQPQLHAWDPVHPVDHVVYAETADDIGDTGGTGRPSWGTAERGERLHQGLVDTLVTYVTQLELLPNVDTTPGRSPV